MSLLLGLLAPAPPFVLRARAYYPDHIPRPQNRAHQQYIFQTMIDRTSPLADARYPDRVDRPRAQQPAAFTTSPQPERTAPLADVRYADRIDRPKSQQQQYFATSPQPERTAPIEDTRFPDRIDRPKAQQQQAFAMGPSPIADVTYVTVLYPDWLPRLRTQQYTFALDPKPEETIQLDWQGYQPARIDRRQMRAADLPFFTFNPQPEQPGSQALAWHPAAIDRPRRTPGWFAFDPKPEETSQLDWSPRYVDRLPRLAPQHTFFFFSPQPEQTIAQALVVYPAAIDRPRRTPGWFALDPKPEQTISLDWQAHYPDRLPRLTPQQQAFTTDPKPEAPVPSSYVSYPDRVERRDVQASVHVAFVFNPQPEAPTPYFNVVYPARIDRPAMPSSQQPFFVTSMEPERTSPLADSIYPDRLPRLEPQHRSVFFDPQPESTIQFPLAIYQDRLPRLEPQHRYFTFDPQPEETIQLDWQPRHPDQIDRRLSPTNINRWFEMDPQPERTAPLAASIYPDYIDRRRFIDGYVTLWPEPIANPPPPPPPPPAKTAALTRHIRAVGGSGVQFDLPQCPPGFRWTLDRTTHRWICVPKVEAKKAEANYAILPLVDEVLIKALADGLVETFKDDKGNLVVRLTADDGTTYFYAKVQKVKIGHVKRGDVIGVSADAAIAPKALPPSSSASPPQSKGVFGVLPVAPTTALPPLPRPRPPTRLTAPRRQTRADVVRATPSVGSAIVGGIGIVGLAILVAALIRGAKKYPKKKHRKKKRRR